MRPLERAALHLASARRDTGPTARFLTTMTLDPKPSPLEPQKPPRRTTRIALLCFSWDTPWASTVPQPGQSPKYLLLRLDASTGLRICAFAWSVAGATAAQFITDGDTIK